VGQPNDSNNDSNFVIGWNQFAWNLHFQQIASRNYVMITLWSCDTGQGQDGADLLFNIAKVTNCAVRASSGQIITDGQSIWLEAKAVWVTATPTVHPSPAPKPFHEVAQMDIRDQILITCEGIFMEIPLGKVLEIKFERTLLGGEKRSHTLAGVAAQDLAWRLFSTKPFLLPGSPTAMITAHARVTFATEEETRTETHEIIVYNDRLVYDTTSGYAYFAREGQPLGL
jgi:hypothetical protein